MAIATFLSELPISKMRQDYDIQTGLLTAQPSMIRHFVEQQARQISDQLIDHSSRIRFQLPDRINAEDGSSLIIPAQSRDQIVGGWLHSLSGASIRDALITRLIQLEQDRDPAVAQCGQMLRFAVAHVMVHQMLPDGQAVHYVPVDDDIPNMPSALKDQSALTSASDAIVESSADEGRLQIPFHPYARRFFLPQWIAFDEEDQLLTSNVAEAESMIASMQNFLEVLHHAVAIAPFIVADEMYQRKRAGMLGQLVNQGRALGRYRTREVIATVQRRARSNNLNRGVNLSLPYFDDQHLKVSLHEMDVIPGGRIPFIGAFMIRASRLEAAQVAQDTRLSQSTRRQLLKQLEMLEKAFRNFK